jgi:hypothetical protein
MSAESPTRSTEGAVTAQEREEKERYEAWMAAHPVVENPQDSPEICAERVAELEASIDAFEQTYDLDALRAITQFSSREESLSSSRQPALEALTPLFKRLKYLKTQDAVSRDTRDALDARYKVVTRAVGQIIADKEGKIFGTLFHGKY